MNYQAQKAAASLQFLQHLERVRCERAPEGVYWEGRMESQSIATAPKGAGCAKSVASVVLGLALGAMAGIFTGLLLGVGIALLLGVL